MVEKENIIAGLLTFKVEAKSRSMGLCSSVALVALDAVLFGI